MSLARAEYATDYLPGCMAEIVEAIGMASALRLVEALGGVDIWVPEQDHLHHQHALVEIIGMEDARRLSLRYARERITLPRCVAAMRAARDAHIRQEYAGGISARRLALEHHLTERQVRNIVRDDDTPNPTGDLFD